MGFNNKKIKGKIKMETLKKNIEREHNGSQTEYAKSNGVKNVQQVNEWLRHRGYWMHEGVLFLKRRDFNGGKS